MDINSDIIVLGIGLILGVLIIKLLAKFMLRLVAIVIIAAVGLYYVYYHTDFFEKHKDNMIVQTVDDKLNFTSILKFEKKFCTDKPKSRTDSITCECIITPLVNDFRERFSAKELKDLEKDKSRYIKEILASLKRNKKQILEELAKRNSTDVWDNIISDLKKGKFLDN